MRREFLTDIGNLAPRISFCSYFLRQYPSPKTPRVLFMRRSSLASSI